MRAIFLFTLYFLTTSAFSQKYTVSGFIKDSVSGEVLSGAIIQNQHNPHEGTYSNEYGFFSFTGENPIQALNVTYYGYLNCKHTVSPSGQTLILMTPDDLSTQEVIIRSELANRNVVNNEMGRISLNIKTIQKLPVLLGEIDVMKTVSLLPGVKQATEGSTGFSVRGGETDQNLILLDDAIVYNPSHLASFMSVFNGDALKGVEIQKGSIPANYGGRLSSVMNVTMKDGNNQKFAGSGGVGLLTSRISLEGPLVKGKSSFMISGRRTFFDLLTVPFLPKTFKGNTYYFYDLNLKVNYILSPKDRIYLSGYTGQDVFKFNLPTGVGVRVNIDYGNQIGALRWNHIFNSRLFSNTTLSFNRYHITYDSKLGENTLYIPSYLQDVSLKNDYQFYATSKYVLKFGAQYQYHLIKPGESESNQSGTIVNARIPSQQADEAALYFSSDYEPNDKWIFNVGLRYSIFNQRGPYTPIQYDSTGVIVQQGQTTPKGKSVQYYHRAEPRAAIRYKTGENTSMKAGYSRMYQYIQLATTSSGLLPTDIWVTANPNILPQVADQFSFGYYYNFNKDRYEASAELYYKPMRNQIEIQPGAPLVFVENIERYLYFGKGLSYGAELFIRKTTGKTTGWIGYTWSKTTRTFPKINGGNPFPSRNDRRHDFSLVINHIFSEKWTGSLNWVLRSGNPITLPSDRITYFLGYGDNSSPSLNYTSLYTGTNRYRMPIYHRMDISFTYTPKPKKVRKVHSSWNFAAYNLYNRMNPFFIFLDVDTETQKMTTQSITAFPIIPSVTWNFSF